MELMIYLALLLIVIGIAYSLFFLSNSSFKKGEDNFQLQSDFRITGDFITSEVRNAVEVEIISGVFTQDGSSQYICIENNRILHKSADGTVSEKSEGTITNTGSSLFTGRKDTASGRWFITVILEGKKNNEEYTLTTEFLLNNISEVVGSSSGNAIRYKKVE